MLAAARIKTAVLTPGSDAARYGFWWLLLALAVVFEVAVDHEFPSLHVLQAQALLKGNLALDRLAWDVAVFDGQYYVPFPPFPAILVLPLVALFGIIDTSLVAGALTVLNAWTIIRICRHFELVPRATTWILLAYLIGTPYLAAFKYSGDVWHFSHVVAFSAALLAIRFALIEKNIWLASAALGAAILSRQLSIYLYPFILACWFQGRSLEFRRLAEGLVKSGLVLAAFGLPYLYFNWLRFGDPFDSGYMYLNHQPFLAERVTLNGLFHPAFIPFNFTYMFLQGPHIEFEGLLPVGMDPFGTSLTFASPFLFLMAFPAGVRRLEVVALVCSGFAVFHMLMYFANGWIQVNGPRFALDFIPMLLVISIQYLKQRRESRWFEVLTLYAIALNLFALVALPAGVRLLRVLMG